MSSFKVVNKSYRFRSEGEIDFIDLSDKVQEEVSRSEIRNGVVHVFAPHATGILVLTENDPALLEDIKRFLEELASKNQDYQHPQTRIHIYGQCFFRLTKPCPSSTAKSSLGLGSRCFLWKQTFTQGKEPSLSKLWAKHKPLK